MGNVAKFAPPLAETSKRWDFLTAMSEFSARFADLDQGSPKERNFVVRAEWIRGVLEDTDTTAAGTDGSMTLRLTASGSDVVVVGELHAALKVPCARCLEPCDQVIDSKISCLMVPAAKVRAPAKDRGDNSEIEFTETEADTLPYDGETLVFDDFVRDELLLETPMIPLCSDDCPGMRVTPVQSETGATEEIDAIDPRLAALKSITLK